MLLYRTAPYSTMTCRGKLRLRTMRGTRRVAPLLAYRPLRLALQCRQRSVMRYTACNAGRSLHKSAHATRCINQQLFDTSRMYRFISVWRILQRSLAPRLIWPNRARAWKTAYQAHPITLSHNTRWMLTQRSDVLHIFADLLFFDPPTWSGLVNFLRRTFVFERSKEERVR